MTKKSKNPLIAAILNFILYGLGYVYAGKRVGFGIGLLLTSVLLYWGISFNDLPVVVWIDSIIISFLLAYDGYRTAEEVNQEK
jgi:uncharacterized protein YacL